MYLHTKNVNACYFGRIGIEVGNEPDIAGCRERGFSLVEQNAGFLEHKVYMGSFIEESSLRKVCRRFP